ncbi:hypothetical protein HYDPIDRAFT_108791 [Hydnomerulius pinastri MD-312]|nr:hypothetical protein HYDPIDRAFT_108791 [Hydnomerulius pinastri MD-312]
MYGSSMTNNLLCSSIVIDGSVAAQLVATRTNERSVTPCKKRRARQGGARPDCPDSAPGIEPPYDGVTALKQSW